MSSDLYVEDEGRGIGRVACSEASTCAWLTPELSISASNCGVGHLFSFGLLRAIGVVGVPTFCAAAAAQDPFKGNSLSPPE